MMQLSEGMELPEIKKLVTQEAINLYAQASRDFNPIHVDEEFARQTPLGGTIAHGMLVLAYISQRMGLAFGQDWFTSGKLDVRFKTPARPGDTIRVAGKILKLEKKEGSVRNVRRTLPVAAACPKPIRKTGRERTFAPSAGEKDGRDL